MDPTSSEQLELFSRFLMSQEGMMMAENEGASQGRGKKQPTSIPFYKTPNFQLGMATFLFITSVCCIRSYSHNLTWATLNKTFIHICLLASKTKTRKKSAPLPALKTLRLHIGRESLRLSSSRWSPCLQTPKNSRKNRPALSGAFPPHVYWSQES